jgi:SAM-dependent MidA family methyltransferase
MTMTESEIYAAVYQMKAGGGIALALESGSAREKLLAKFVDVVLEQKPWDLKIDNYHLREENARLRGNQGRLLMRISRALTILHEHSDAAKALRGEE